MTGQPKPLIRFETPPEGVRVKCDRCGTDQFYLAVHFKLGGALVTRTAECASCGARDLIDAPVGDIADG